MRELSGGRKRLTISNCKLEDSGKVRYTHGKECETWAWLTVKKRTAKNIKDSEEKKRLLAKRAEAEKAGTLS